MLDHMARNQRIESAMQLLWDGAAEVSISPDEIHILDAGNIDSGMPAIFLDERLARKMIYRFDIPSIPLWGYWIVRRPDLKNLHRTVDRSEQDFIARWHIYRVLQCAYRSWPLPTGNRSRQW